LYYEHALLLPIGIRHHIHIFVKCISLSVTWKLLHKN